MTLKMVEITFSEGHFLTKNFDFRGHISTFRAENTPKEGLLRPKMMPKPLLNNSKLTFKKSKKRLFWPQNGQIRGPILVKVLIFGCILGLKA